MAGKRWLVALLLVTSSAAQAQYEPTQVTPAQGAPIQAPPGRTTPEQTTPGQTTPGQTTPGQTTPGQTTPGQAPYVPPPLGAPGSIVVPPYPGLVPSTFASAAEFVDYGSWRLKQLTARERGLALLGRPQDYQAKRAGAFLLLGSGGTLTVVCAMLLFLGGGSIPHSGEDELSDRAQIGLATAALFGAGLAVGGLVWLKLLKVDNPYRAEIRGLQVERARLGKDIKRARKQARLERRLSFDLARLEVRF
jgi:hypothetical protein